MLRYRLVRLSLRGSFPLPVACLIGASLLLYGWVLLDLSRNWIRDETYSHGFLVLPVVAYLIWKRRGQLASTERRPVNGGLLIVVGSLIMLLVGTAGVEFFLMRTSAVGVAVGAVLFVAGWRWLRILLFPLAFALLMIPLPAIVFYQIAFPLQLLATRFGVAVLQLAAVPVLREGNVIVLAHATLEVAEACSGIHSLVSLFALAVLFGYLADLRLGRRLLIALLSIPIAIIANGARVAGTGIAAHYVGAAAASGFLHAFSGVVVFAASFAMLMGLAGIMRAIDPPAAIGRPEPAL